MLRTDKFVCKGRTNALVTIHREDSTLVLSLNSPRKHFEENELISGEMTETVKGTARCPEDTFFDEKINLANSPLSSLHD